MAVAREKNFVSCIVYLHNDGNRVRDFMSKVCGIIQENFEKYEIICVNDGCVDDTLEQARNFLREDGGSHVVSLINLSYYQGVEAAMNAGRDLAVGDFIFEFDSCTMDFESSLILDVYRKSLEGYDVVAASPRHYIPLTSKLFYFVYNLGSHKQNRLRQDRFRIVSRREVNRVNQLNVYIPYRKALYASCGLRMETVFYENARVAPRERRREERGSRSVLAMDTLIIFTDVLEKLSMLLSVLFFGALLVVFGDIVYSALGAIRPVEGWLSIMALMSLGFFMLFVLLTLIFKYLSVILNVSFKRQRYVIEGVEKLTK